MTGHDAADIEEPDCDPADARSQPRRMTRRTVLKAAGIGGGAVLIAGAAGVGTRGGANGVWSHGQGAPYELWTTWQDAPGLMRLAAAGTLAANPHNIQPWTFAVGEDTIDLYADAERAMPACDPDDRERVAGYGCALQNITVAARAAAADATITLWPGDDPKHIAQITFAPGTSASPRERALAEAISNRHTNRGPYAAGAIGTDVLDTLTQDAPGAAEVGWITAATAMAAMGEIYVEATQEIVNDQEMSRESYEWFRNDRADIDHYRDGLTLDCQGLAAFTLLMAKILPAQSRTAGDAFWVNTTRDTHTATARAYGIIRVTDTADPAARIAGGRLLQHVHLAATEAGLGLHHMNQVTERIARDATLGNPDQFSARWANATGVDPDETLLAFRLGYPERTPNPSPRRDLADITKHQ